MVNHLELNQAIVDSHHGFEKGRSCLTNLLSFLERVTGFVDNGDNVDVLFLDFAKAFDKVAHQRFLKKLNSHIINGKQFEWMKSWLNNRVQRVVLNDKGSTLAAYPKDQFWVLSSA